MKIIGKSPHSWPQNRVIHGNSCIILYFWLRSLFIYNIYHLGFFSANTTKLGKNTMICTLTTNANFCIGFTQCNSQILRKRQFTSWYVYIPVSPVPVWMLAWWPGITNANTTMSVTAVQRDCFYAYVTYKWTVLWLVYSKAILAGDVGEKFLKARFW